MITQVIFSGGKDKVLKMIKAMGEFATLGNFFKIQNEVMSLNEGKTKKEKEREFIFPNQISIYEGENYEKI